jgi:hypothetical protein
MTGPDICPHCGMRWSFTEDIDHSALGASELERRAADDADGREPGDKITCVACRGRSVWRGPAWLALPETTPENARRQEVYLMAWMEPVATGGVTVKRVACTSDPNPARRKPGAWARISSAQGDSLEEASENLMREARLYFPWMSAMLDQVPGPADYPAHVSSGMAKARWDAEHGPQRLGLVPSSELPSPNQSAENFLKRDGRGWWDCKCGTCGRNATVVQLSSDNDGHKFSVDCSGSCATIRTNYPGDHTKPDIPGTANGPTSGGTGQ